MTIEPSSANAGLIARVQNILMKPRAEWGVIATEPADVGKLYIGYVLPLAALAAICAFIGTSIIGTSLFGVAYRMPITFGVVMAVMQLGMGLLGVFIMAMVTNALAPNFGSQQDQGQAHKLAAYGVTGALIGGVFSIFPPIAILGALAAIYSLVLIYLGLPRLMKTPEDKRVGYFATIIVVCIVVGFVLNMILGSIMMATGAYRGMPGMQFGANAPHTQTIDGQMTLPGGGAIDLSELEKQANAAASMAASGASASVSPDAMQAMLPQNLPGGFSLGSTSASGVAGTTQAEGVYTRGDARMTLTLVHMGQIGALASMAGAMGVTESTQDANGYSRMNTVDGRVISERLDRASGTASYGVVGRGVAVTAEGHGVTVEEVRGAVEAVGVQRLEAMSAS